MATPFSVRATKPSNPYPNELPGFKFYAQYLYPLRPLDSVRAQVVMVLGSDQRIEAGRWWISPVFLIVKNGTQNHVVINRLSQIVITPRQRVSMSSIKFPAAFTHQVGGIPEGGISEVLNGSFDIYGDVFGLEYVLYTKDAGDIKKGDLFQIVYGPPR